MLLRWRPLRPASNFGGDHIARCSSASAIVETAPFRAGPVCREMPTNRNCVSVSRAWRSGHSARSPVLRFSQQGESAAAHASPGEGPPFQPRVTPHSAYSSFPLPLWPHRAPLKMAPRFHISVLPGICISMKSHTHTEGVCVCDFLLAVVCSRDPPATCAGRLSGFQSYLYINPVPIVRTYIYLSPALPPLPPVQGQLTLPTCSLYVCTAFHYCCALGSLLSPA